MTALRGTGRRFLARHFPEKLAEKPVCIVNFVKFSSETCCLISRLVVKYNKY